MACREVTDISDTCGNIRRLPSPLDNPTSRHLIQFIARFLVITMASKENDGLPEKRARTENNSESNYCGLTLGEVRHLKALMDNSDSLSSSDEEPFQDSGSEYLPSEHSSDKDSSVHSATDEVQQDELDERRSENNDEILEPPEKDYSDIVINWLKNDFVPKLYQFDETDSGVKNDTLTEDSREIDYFLNLFTEDTARYIIAETNRYAAQQKQKNWVELDLNDFFTFVALTMLMPRNKKLEIKEYWSVNPLLHTPIFGQKMSRDRYLQILQNLHFVNNEEEQNNTTRLYKVQNILEQIKQRFGSQFYPFQNVVIDESMVLFKGRLNFKQYIKTKRHRFGIKLYVICDCETGYILHFIVYIGKGTYNPDENIAGLGASGNIVAMLMNPYLNKGHSLYTDNFYSSPILSNFLHEHNTNSCGTVRINRQHMPPLNEKLKKGEVTWRSSDKFLVLKWKDRRDVTMITTMHENKIITLDKIDTSTNENVKKPLCVIDYNASMGAVDRSDMMISSINCMRKTIKWYKKLFMHTLDMCVLNSHAMFTTRQTTKFPLAKFQLNLLHQILER